MQPKTEELLYSILWVAELAARPTFRNLTEGYESWAYRNGLRRQLNTLERRDLIESRTGASSERVYRLTSLGRQHAFGTDPREAWSRRWDGQWRMVVYDVPQARASERARLRNALRERGFGYLQNSVWITPDPLVNERERLRETSIDVQSLVLLEARPCAGESDAHLVAGAWNFEAINKSYADYLEVLGHRPRQSLDSKAAAEKYQHWLRKERSAWIEAMRLDPLLPERLLPAGYRGKEAWRARLAVMKEVGVSIRDFRIPI